jgi:hypothetical protein
MHDANATHLRGGRTCFENSMLANLKVQFEKYQNKRREMTIQKLDVFLVDVLKE